jgi:hypothetical protein
LSNVFAFSAALKPDWAKLIFTLTAARLFVSQGL